MKNNLTERLRVGTRQGGQSQRRFRHVQNKAGIGFMIEADENGKFDKSLIESISARDHDSKTSATKKTPAKHRNAVRSSPGARRRG